VPEDSPPARRATPVTTSRRRILVVDDSSDSAESLSLLLSIMGHEVFTALSGSSALLAVREHRPELVLLDVSMPDMDGYEVARRVRQDEALRGVRLVALTGWADAEDRRRSQEAGFDVHLVKPTDREALESLLSTI
jgi:CheY-like chemotaxis protein